MKKIVIATIIASAALALGGCNSEAASTSEPAAAPVKQTISDASKATIDALTPEKLVDFVRSAKGSEYIYADKRLAAVLKSTTDEKLVQNVTENRLPFGEAMFEANMAKLRLKK